MNTKCQGRRSGTRIALLASFFLLFTGALGVAGNMVDAQTTTLTIDLQEVPIKTVLKEIEQQTDFTFVYNESQVDVYQTVSLKLQDAPLSEALDAIFKGRPVEYRILKKQVVLVAASNKGQRSRDKAGIDQEEKRVIKGVVSSSEENMPIPGASVVVKGTTRGTITNINGEYELEVLGTDSVLVFSFMGMESKEVSLGSKILINVVLDPAVKELEEVVVVGYGTESRSLLTSSVGTVSADEIRDVPVSSIDAAMQGKSAGVQVTQNSGTPGAAISVRVRGVSSIEAGNEPLYIIDGIPVITGDFSQVGFSGQGINALSDINTADIESISVLRDASAASIYGARASNGVIIITTKRGKAQKTSFNFRAYTGWQEVADPLEMLNARQWMEFKNEQSISAGGLPLYSEEEITNPPVDTDWLDEVLRVAPISSYELTASGGSQKTKFFTSGSYFDQEGTLIGTDYQKASGRVNVDHTVNNKLSLGASFALTWSKNNRKEGDQSLNSPMANAISLPPIYPVYNEDGTFNDDGPYANPVNIGEQHLNESFNYRNLGNIFADYKITNKLNFHTKWGIDYLNLREHTYDPPTTRQGGKYNGLGIESSTEVVNVVSNNTVDYINTFNNVHNVKLMAGYSFEKYQRRSNYIRGQDFPNEQLQYITSAATITEASVSGLDRGLTSFFGQVKYNYAYKYLVTLSARADGSSKFGENNQFGFFPSVSLAWRAIEEEFMLDYPVISDLKFRLSYGLTGNDGIPDFSSIGLYSGGANYGSSPGLYPSQLPNPDLKWEQTAQLNFGFDLGLWDNRLVLAADLYQKKTKDLLLSKPIPGSSGFTSIISNIGEMENKGFELSLTSENIKGEFNWISTLNFSLNRNEVTKLYNDQPIDNIGRGGNRIEVGEPIGIFYNWNSLGVDPTTGDLVFEDVNGDGEITTEDRVRIGNPHPDFIGGFSNDFLYKGFKLSVFLQFSYGNDIFNGTRRYIESMKGADNQTIAILDRWREPGDETEMPRATLADPNANDRMSSRYVEDGSYLRVKNVRLSYMLDVAPWFNTDRFKVELYAAAQNLLTFTDYSGMDPEVNYAGQDDIRMGTDFFTYPQARILMLGINVEF